MESAAPEPLPGRTAGAIYLLGMAICMPAIVAEGVVAIATHVGRAHGATLRSIDWAGLIWLTRWLAMWLAFVRTYLRVRRAEVQRGYTTEARYQALHRHDLYLLHWRTKAVIGGPL